MYLEVARTFGIRSIFPQARPKLFKPIYGALISLLVRVNFVLMHLDSIPSLPSLVGTYSIASGTTYEAESGTISGSATILTGSSFSGGKAVGYLGRSGQCRSLYLRWSDPRVQAMEAP